MGAVGTLERAAGLVTRPRPAGIIAKVIGGVAAVDLPTALVQVASVSGVVAGVCSMDSALHDGRCLPDALVAALPVLTGRARARAEEAIAQVDAACESVGESRTRLLLVDLGYVPTSQVEIRDVRGNLLGRVDFVVADRVVVEFDGRVKYEGADGARALMAEKARESALAAEGFEIVRLTWPDLDAPARVAAQLRMALARSRRRG